MTSSIPTPAPTPAAERAPIRQRRWLTWLGQGLLIVAVYWGVSAYTEQGLIDGPAPAFELRDLEGRTVSLESFRGKRVLLHFWATWCGVCLREFGAMNDVAAQSGPEQVVLSVVSDSEDIEKLQKFARENGLRYPVLLADEQVIRAYAIRAYPTNYFLNAAGEIVSRTVGMSSRWSMRARLAFAR